MNECERIYRIVLEGVEDDYALFELADCFLKGFDTQNLALMLDSRDLGVLSDGLFVLNEVGTIAEEFIPKIELLCGHADSEISARAEKLMVRLVRPSHRSK